MSKTFSLHKITNEETFTFSPNKYSQFKFGNLPLADEFGEDLFEGFLEEFKDVLLNNEIHVFPSPYMAIPTASNFLAKSFKRKLDLFLYKHDLPSSKEGKISRCQTFTADYGNLSFEERKRLISGDTYYIDRDSVEGKTCIFIDDVKITGSHEFTVKKILEEHNVNGNFIFAYYGELTNMDIDPKIENKFNYSQINSVITLADLVTSYYFTFNTRVVKYILNLPTGDFDQFTKLITDEKIKQLVSLAISNDYHLIDEYKHNLKKIVEWQLIYEKAKKLELHQKNSQ